MIRVTTAQLGRAAGFLILVLIVVGLAYGVTAWVTFEINPARWSAAARAWAAGLVFILLILRWLVGVVEIAREE